MTVSYFGSLWHVISCYIYIHFGFCSLLNATRMITYSCNASMYSIGLCSLAIYAFFGFSILSCGGFCLFFTNIASNVEAITVNLNSNICQVKKGKKNNWKPCILCMMTLKCVLMEDLGKICWTLSHHESNYQCLYTFIFIY